MGSHKIDDYISAEGYLLSLNVAAKPYGINYSYEIKKRFDPKKCSWIVYSFIYKWKTKSHKRIGMFGIYHLEDMVEYINLVTNNFYEE